METKSRYEIIAELEEKKAKLINAKASLGLTETQLKMEIEKAEEALKDFIEQKDIQAQNIEDQLESINNSLERFNSQKKQN